MSATLNLFPHRLGFSQSQKQLQPHSSVQRHLSKTRSPNNFIQTQVNSFRLTNTVIPTVKQDFNPDRLVNQRPSHKTLRHKFDRTKSQCLLEKENEAFTMEDTFDLQDRPWISSLRFDETGQPKNRIRSIDGPPAFYQDDQINWEKKFEKANKDRAALKAQKEKLCEYNTTGGTKNFNVKELMNTQKISNTRRKSRYSTETFLTVDFDSRGNTNNINHLIQRRPGGLNADRCMVDHEANLRQYKNSTNYQHEKPWVWPPLQPKRAVVVDKGAFVWPPRVHKKGLDDPHAEPYAIKSFLKGEIQQFDDHFKIPNVNTIRPLLSKEKNLPEAYFESSLRFYKWEPPKKEGET